MTDGVELRLRNCAGPKPGYRWLPILVIDGREVSRGEHRATPSEACDAAWAMYLAMQAGGKA